MRLINPTCIYSSRAVEITCPTSFHDKLDISIYLSWEKFKDLYFIFDSYEDELSCCGENSKTMWILISWLIQKPADLNQQVVFISVYIWFQTVLKDFIHTYCLKAH